nr:unnamed protein product [Callosobruchus analis]
MLYLRRCTLVISVCVFQTVVEAGFTTTKISPRPIWNSTDTDKLRKDLLLNYDKFARPAQHFNATAVRFGLSILHVEANEFKSTFTVYSVLHLAWTDEKLKWNSSDYGGIKKLHLAEHEIWQPDISLFNSASSISVSHYSNTHFVAFSYGEVSWSPPAQFTVLCNFDLRYWPFDTQHCHLHFMSWTYNGDQIDIDFIDSKAITVRINTTWMSLPFHIFPKQRSPQAHVTSKTEFVVISSSHHALLDHKTSFVSMKIPDSSLGYL